MKRYTKGSKYGTATVLNSGDSFCPAKLERDTGGKPLGKEAYPRFCSPVRVRVVLYGVRLTDVDNCCVKYAIDALVAEGILVDDSPKYVKEITHSHVKVKNKSEEKTVIGFEEV
jgi:hypothetical protein